MNLKHKSTNQCFLTVAGADNNNANSNSIIFTIEDTKLYVPATALSAKDNQELAKLLSKGFKRLVYLYGYKTKSENKDTANKCRYFIESNFVGVYGLFVLVYSNQDDNSERYDLPKDIIKNHNVIINGNTSLTNLLILTQAHIDEKNFGGNQLLNIVDDHCWQKKKKVSFPIQICHFKLSKTTRES